MDLDVVIIGLNAERTLEACLRSVLASRYEDGQIRIFYVDSGSSDRSCEIAAGFPGVTVLSLETEHPSPGAGRNLGWKAGRAPLVQFLDSDTELHEDWLALATGFLQSHPEAAAVRGNRTERNPEASVYNWIADLEWNAAPGECSDFGGDVLIHRRVLEATGGYDEELVGGEDPELSQRVRKRSESPNRIFQLDAPMTNHDMAMFRVKQYWKRGYRTRYGYAAVIARHPDTGDGFWKEEIRRILIRGGVGSFLALAGLVGTLFHPLLLLATAAGLGLVFYPRLFRVPRFAEAKNLPTPEARTYAWHCSLVVIPEFFGIVRHRIGTWFRRPLRNRRPAAPDSGERGKIGTAGRQLLLLFTIGLSVLQSSCIIVAPGSHLHPEDDHRSRKKNFNVDGQFQTDTKKKEINYASAEKLAAMERDLPTDYLLGPGDVVSINTRQRPEASADDLVISPDGKLSVPRIGILPVEGRTLEWLTDTIRTGLLQYYSDPDVNVTVKQFNNNKVFVLGRISNPGRIDMEGNGTLLEVLASAGGMPTVAAEAFLTRATIFRGRDTVMWVDLRKLLNEGNTAMNPKLRNNDIVFIPESDDELVYVMGEVRNPGAVKLKTELSYLDAVMATGGPTRGAKMNRLYLIRKNQDGGYVQPIDLGKMLEVADFRQDYLLRDGDILYVTPSPLSHVSHAITELSPALSYLSLAAAFGGGGNP